ncbi:hypothetical protein HYPSUDRAFT_129677 [Hypholoma sublateritium FD-334 SS-4]|uniref:Flavin reductase like domain-containing protein n=1 Tax=Hypholoma sublateritium (strain FD-334 SS-4) TaxID=945553 RepID=A0A0D2PHG3_HYPSF|nr:hypothetical protein HYPSUDRAFT_129677 [Hypholoma sublateritium FD-334 SS-4]
MSGTIVHQQCRTLPRVLASNSYSCLERGASHHTSLGSSRTSQWKRLVHTARAHAAHPHHGHSSRISRQDIDHIQSRELKHDLRLILRNTAQPVAVVTSFMPGHAAAGSSSQRSSSTGQNDAKYHGATLSSFTSIAMDPYPLVAFALRVPSRMATTLSALAPSLPPSAHTKSASSHSSHMVINLLSASQASTAITFSRPDLYPMPFVSGSHSEKQEYTLSKDGLPVLHDVVGALSCRLVSGPIPLHDLDYFGSGIGAKVKEPELAAGCVSSELFIARVMRVEKVPTTRNESAASGEEESERTFPLVYHRRSYTSCHPRSGRRKD